MTLRHLVCLAFCLAFCLTSVFAGDPARVLIIVGPSKHPPGSHEVAAGGRVMQHCLENMTNQPGVKTNIPGLATFNPVALDYVPPPPKPKKIEFK